MNVSFKSFLLISEKDYFKYLKIKTGKIILKEEIVIFNKSDLVNMDLSTKKLKEF